MDITAQSLSITASGVGTASDALDTSVDTLSLVISGAAYVNEANALTVSSANTGLFSLSTAGATTLQSLTAQTTTVNASAGTVNVVSADVAAFTLTAAGATNLQSVNATGNVTVTLSAGDLTVGSLTAANQTVSLNTTGQVLDGDAGVDITAQSLSITASGVGTGSDALDTSVDTLSLVVSGAAYVNEADTLTVSSATTGLFSLTAAGATNLQSVNATGNVTVTLSTGDLTVGSLTAARARPCAPPAPRPTASSTRQRSVACWRTSRTCGCSSRRWTT